MKKIVFGITSLGIGGAERVLVDVANALKDEYEVTIFALYKGGAFEKELDEKVNLISLYKKPYENYNKLERKTIPIKVLLAGKKIYKKYIKGKFDVEVAFLEGPITRIFSNKGNAKKIVWVHNDIGKVFGNSFKSKLKNKIDKKIYNKYNDIVFVSNDNKEAFNTLYFNNNSDVGINEHVIYNYIDKKKIIEKSQENVNDIKFSDKYPTIVTLARLVEQKAIDRLIKIHKRIIDENIKHEIYIIGEGPERTKLENMIKEYNVQETFKLLGKRNNPYPYVKEADYFALLTYFEGYPMAVEEAKILNKEIIITNTAAKEVLKGYKNGTILENNEEDIYNGLKRILMQNKIPKEDEILYDNSKYLMQIKEIL